MQWHFVREECKWLLNTCIKERTEKLANTQGTVRSHDKKSLYGRAGKEP